MKNPVMFIYNAFKKLSSVTLNVSTKNEFSIATILQLIVLNKVLFLVSTTPTILPNL